MSLILQGFGEEDVSEFTRKFKLKIEKLPFSRNIKTYRFNQNVIKKRFLIRIENDCKT